MTIQIPNVGTGVPADQTGDSPWLAMTKVAANFSNQTHAASRLVGTEAGQIPLAQDTLKVVGATRPTFLETANPDDFEAGSLIGFPIAAHPAISSLVNSEYALVVRTTYMSRQGNLLQVGYSWMTGTVITRVKVGTWSVWQLASTAVATYNTTTASGANVAIGTDGKLMRSTSSEQYKDILAPLVLDDARYADAMALKPIVYRSTADADNPLHHYYSFSAEELGAYDPAFTLWRTTEMVTDADGITTEQPLAERQAEGININALLAMSHAIAIKQDKMIKAQAAAIATLTQRIDTITA